MPATAEEFYNDPSRWQKINLSGRKVRMKGGSTVLDILPKGIPFHYQYITFNEWASFTYGVIVLESGKYQGKKLGFECKGSKNNLSNESLQRCLENSY